MANFELHINAKGEGSHVGIGKLEGTEAEINQAIDLLKDFCSNNSHISKLIVDMSGGPVKRPNQLPPWM